MKSVSSYTWTATKWVVRGIGALILLIFVLVAAWIGWDLWSLEQMAKDFRSQLTGNRNVFEFAEKNPRFYMISLDSPTNQNARCPSLSRDFRELEMMRVVSADTNAQTQRDGKSAAAAGSSVSASAPAKIHESEASKFLVEAARNFKECRRIRLLYFGSRSERTFRRLTVETTIDDGGNLLAEPKIFTWD